MQRACRGQERAPEGSRGRCRGQDRGAGGGGQGWGRCGWDLTWRMSCSCSIVRTFRAELSSMSWMSLISSRLCLVRKTSWLESSCSVVRLFLSNACGRRGGQGWEAVLRAAARASRSLGTISLPPHARPLVVSTGKCGPIVCGTESAPRPPPFHPF